MAGDGDGSCSRGTRSANLSSEASLACPNDFSALRGESLSRSVRSSRARLRTGCLRASRASRQESGFGRRRW